jgi:hypothetical protein
LLAEPETIPQLSLTVNSYQSSFKILISQLLLVGCRNVQEPEPKATGGTSDEPATVFANIRRAIEDNDPEAFINSYGPLSDEVRQILQAQFNVLRASHLLRKEIRDRFGEDGLAEFETGFQDIPFIGLPDTMFAKLDWVQEIEVVDDRANVIVAAKENVDPVRRTAEGMLLRIDGQWRMNAEHLAELAELPERQRKEAMEGSEKLVRIFTALREHAAEKGSSVAAVLEEVTPLLLGIDRRSMPKPPSLPDVPVRPLESLPEQVEVEPTDPELAFAGEPVALQPVHVFGGLGPISAVAVSSDGSRVVSASPATLALRDAASGELLAMPRNIAPRNNPREISSIGFSPDGSRLLINGGGFIEIWDPQTLQRLHVIEDSRIGRAAVFARDGSTVVASHHLALVCGLAHGGGYAVTRRGLKVQVVRTGNGERLTEVTQPNLKVQIVDPGNRERLTEIDLEPLLGDTDWVVTKRSTEGRDRRYDRKEDAADKTQHYISCVDVSSDGSHLVTVVGRTVTSKSNKKEDGDSLEWWEVRQEVSRTATLWDVKTGKPIHTFEGRPGLDSKHTTPGTDAEQQIRQVAEGATAIWFVRFTPTGEHLLISAGGKASLWNVASAERIAGFEGALGIANTMPLEAVPPVHVRPLGRHSACGSRRDGIGIVGHGEQSNSVTGFGRNHGGLLDEKRKIATSVARRGRKARREGGSAPKRPRRFAPFASSAALGPTGPDRRPDATCRKRGRTVGTTWERNGRHRRSRPRSRHQVDHPRPHLPLLPPIQLRRDRPQIPLRHRIAPTLSRPHRQDRLLNVRRQIQERHDLRQPRPRHVPQPGQLGLIFDHPVPNHTVEPNRQGHQQRGLGSTLEEARRN